MARKFTNLHFLPNNLFTFLCLGSFDVLQPQEVRISTLMSRASLPAVPLFILVAGGADQGCPIQPRSIDIKNEDADLIRRGSVTKSATATPTEQGTRSPVRIMN